MNRRVVVFNENAGVDLKNNDEAKKANKRVALSDANTQHFIPKESFSPKRKRVKFASTSPEVCVFNKDESADMIQTVLSRNTTLIPQRQSSKLRSPKINRHPLPQPIIRETIPMQPRLDAKGIRKRRLAKMNTWNMRRRQNRMLNHITQEKELDLSMRFGELSDDFYKYCRRWKRNSDEFVNNVLREIELSFVPFTLHCNFRYYTQIMFHTPSLHFQLVESLVCLNHILVSHKNKSINPNWVVPLAVHLTQNL